MISELPLPTVWSSRRWRIAVLLGIGVLVNFFDRVNLSVAITPLKGEFGLSTVAIGYLLSTYSWTYVLLQLPSGPVLDRYGVKPVIRISALLWSVASFATGLARGFAGIISARLLLGVAEAPTFPGNAKAIGVWFPRNERGLATAIFDASAKFASAIGIPLVAIVVHYWGWRMSFVVTGVLSLAYFALFWFVYRDPTEDSRLLPAEREHIAAGGGQAEATVDPGHAASLFFLLRRKKVWGLALGMAAYNYNFYLFLTWLPGYLSSSMHLDVLQSGFYTAIPWLAATVSDLRGGWMAGGLPDPFRARCNAGPANHPGSWTGTRIGGGRSHAYHEPARRHLLDFDRPVWTGGVGSRRLVDSRTDCASGKHGAGGGHHEFHRQPAGHPGTSHHRVSGGQFAIVSPPVPGCGCSVGRRHPVLLVSTGQNRNHSGTGHNIFALKRPAHCLL